jgi:hypothetical protein
LLCCIGVETIAYGNLLGGQCQRNKIVLFQGVTVAPPRKAARSKASRR